MKILNDSELRTAMDLIQMKEGFAARPYKCPAGKWTFGFGRLLGDKKVITETSKEAELEWLKGYLNDLAAQIARLWKGFGGLKHTGKAAVLSLVYNIGLGAFKDSSLLKGLRIGLPIKDLKAHWQAWIYAKGRRLKGLVNRRIKEWSWFIK